MISVEERRGPAGGCSAEGTGAGGGSSTFIDGEGGDSGEGLVMISDIVLIFGAACIGTALFPDFSGWPEYRHLLTYPTASSEACGHLTDLLGCRMQDEGPDARRYYSPTGG